MSYGAPPAKADIVPAIVVALTNTIIVPAPGPGKRIRIVGGQLVISRTAAAAIVDLTFTDGAGGAVIYRALGLSLNGSPGGPTPIPEPGIQLSDNTALVVAEAATAATGQYAAVAYYYIDNVS